MQIGCIFFMLLSSPLKERVILHLKKLESPSPKDAGSGKKNF